MAENGGISADEFTRLQTQLIELRTQNYEIAEKYRKTKDENNSLQERVESKEKELQKYNKLMKLPGFQAFTKNKGKKSYNEVVEENERLALQMQRHEEDFNLQNKTLLEEVSRLSAERDEIENELKKLKDTRHHQHDESDELRRIKVENTVLHKKLQDYENRFLEHAGDAGKIDHTDSGGGEKVPGNEAEAEVKSIRSLVESVFSDLLNAHINSDEMQPVNANQSSIMEKFITDLEILLNKHQMSSDATVLSQDMNVSLETEQAENQLLRDEIKQERERTSSEIDSLKAEIDKLAEKAKRKQELYIQLNDEKETLHSDKRHLEDEWIKTKEQLAQSNETIADLEQQIVKLGKDKEEIQNEVIALTEKIELTSLKSQLEESSALNQDMISEVHKLSEEKNRLQEESSENLELANKRKKLLDELSVERQHELTSHKQELDDVRNENEEQKRRIETLMSDLERVKREVTLSTDRHSELLKTYNSLDKKCGWLERTLKDTESQIEVERQQLKEEIAAMALKFEEEKEELKETQRLEIEKLEEEKHGIEQERDEKLAIIDKMNQAAKDREVEFRVSGKKNDQLLKDLKRQLKSERKRADQIQQRLQDFLSEPKARQSFDEIFKPGTSLNKGHHRQDSGSHLSTVSSGSGLEMNADGEGNKTSTPLSGTPLSSSNDSTKLTSETAELISRVADLQLEKNVLEEKVRHLEENSSVLVEDLMRKTEIIQNYVRDTKTDMYTDAARKKNMTLKEKMKDTLSIGKQGKSEDMLKEMNLKMQRVLEETLEKNIQMEKHIDQLTKELEKHSKNPSS